MDAIQAVPTSTGYYMSSDPIVQVLTGITIVFLLYLVLATLEYVYKSFTRMWKDRVELFPNTYTSGSRMYTAIQNPSNTESKTIYISKNQRSGIEFSYSMFVFLNSDTFSTGHHTLQHILHKGYNQLYPLLGPGLFCWGDTNTIRVYMNCYDTWNNYSDIQNIPVDKWFHITISCKANTLYVYINGNLKTKMSLSASTPPYQNYGNVYLFNSRKMTIRPNPTSSLNLDPDFTGNQPALTSLVFDGSAKGMASRVYYFSYALTYSEIQSLMHEGPSSVMSGTDMSLAPYLSDTWWTNKQGP